MNRWVQKSLLVLVMMTAFSSLLSAGDTPCIGVLTGTFDNVIVPSGATCFLISSTVNGNVKAHEAFRLFIESSLIHGSVEANKTVDSSQVLNSIVRQNIQMVEGGDPGGFNTSAVVCGTIILEGNVEIEKIRGVGVLVGPSPGTCGNNSILKGNLKVADTSVSRLEIFENSVAQDLQVFKNVGSGAKDVQNNSVGGNLQCFENHPPFVGTPNVAEKAEGQCAP